MVNSLRKSVILIDAKENIYFGNITHQGGSIPLRQTACDHKQFAAAGFFIFRHIKDTVDGFGFCRIDKGTGIDNDNICFRKIRRNAVSLIFHDTQSNLGIDQIFVAAEEIQADFPCLVHKEFLSLIGIGQTLPLPYILPYRIRLVHENTGDTKQSFMSCASFHALAGIDTRLTGA